MFLFDFDTDIFLIGIALIILYRLGWFSSGRGTFSGGGDK
jgi:hypothetical protein